MTFQELLEEIGEKITTRAKDNLVKHSKIATGTLYDSIKYTISKNQLSIDMASYGKFVNDGRKPGKFVPVDSLNKWLKIKGIDLKYSYVINRAIKERGIPRTNFMTNAVELTVKEMDSLIEDFVDDIFENIKI